MDVEKLIESVRGRAPGGKFYINVPRRQHAARKEDAWKEVAEELGEERPVCIANLQTRTMTCGQVTIIQLVSFRRQSETLVENRDFSTQQPLL